jgi:hypothetical protein
VCFDYCVCFAWVGLELDEPTDLQSICQNRLFELGQCRVARLCAWMRKVVAELPHSKSLPRNVV